MENMFKVGDVVYVVADAIYLNNDKEVPASLLNVKLYVREVKENSCVIARAKTGSILGEVANDFLKNASVNAAAIDPYIVQIPVANFPVYNSFNKNSGVIKRLNRFALFTIVDEKNGFGKLKVGAGWIELDKVTKL